MRITSEQIEIIKSFVCERLTSNPQNERLIMGFTCERGPGLVAPLKLNGWKQDTEGETAYYLIKTPAGRPCMFFSLKAGALFTPLDEEEEMRKRVEIAKMVIDVLSRPEEDEQRRKIVDSMGEMDPEIRDRNIEAFIGFEERRKRESVSILRQLNYDKSRETNQHIQRVKETLSGIELTHFCTDDNEKKIWKQYKFNFPLGAVMFWSKIVPIVIGIQARIGCQNLFLFAADDTQDGVLINYYQETLKFQMVNHVGTTKPRYDFGCSFMSQPINQLRLHQWNFFEHFNPDPDDIIA